MPEWSFRLMQRGELNVDPIQSEFFSTEAINGLTEALVRESIQNTLDAAQKGTSARVRFWFSGQHDVSAKGQYFERLERHLQAPGSGLKAVPSFKGPVPFMLIEDFGTRGLCGSFDQDKDISEVKNDFYYFWRNVGRSGKHDKDRGRWGLGKDVFPASSRINSFLGLTIRNEKPAALLMGQAVLKVHELEGIRRYPYGYFAEAELNDGFARPVTDLSILAQFRTDFCLRRTNECGLSIVVPFPDPEITEEGVLKAVLRQYFFPIMTGTLVVTVGHSGAETEVDKASLSEIIDKMGGTFSRQLKPVVRLAEWAASKPATVRTKEPLAGVAPKWESEAIQEDVLQEIRPIFEQGKALAFDVPVYVKPDPGHAKLSFFQMFLERDITMESHRPTFVREGLIITDAVKTKLRGVRALVVVTDQALATMLGDAENPAHTEWQARSAHFKDKYQHGPSTLSYVKNSIVSIVQMLTESKDQHDLTSLADIFFLALPPKHNEKEVRVPAPAPVPAPPDPAQPRVLHLRKVDGGFTLDATEKVSRVHITAAYEIRRGDAFKKYQQADFEMDNVPIQIAVRNTVVIEASLNQLTVGPLEPGSKVTVTGFDPSRDLKVRTSMEE